MIHLIIMPILVMQIANNDGFQCNLYTYIMLMYSIYIYIYIHVQSNSCIYTYINYSCFPETILISQRNPALLTVRAACPNRPDEVAGKVNGLWKLPKVPTLQYIVGLYTILQYIMVDYGRL